MAGPERHPTGLLQGLPNGLPQRLHSRLHIVLPGGPPGRRSPAAWRGALAILTLACAAHPGAPGVARAATVSGTLTLAEHGEPVADAAAAIVYFVPEGGARPSAPPLEAEIVMRDRHFSPRAVAVPLGSSVRFPNADPIRHNVFSVSPSGRFDLGLYGTGKGKAQRFDQPGLVRVFCNVHRSMSAFVLVLDTPFHTAPEASGRFTLSGLPDGPGTLHVWHPRAEAWSRPLQLPFPDSLRVRLDVTLPAVPPHLDKHGQPYRDTPDDDRYR
jgi:plastocyanin